MLKNQSSGNLKSSLMTSFIRARDLFKNWTTGQIVEETMDSQLVSQA